MFGTVIVPPAADFVGSKVTTSKVTPTRSLPPALGVFAGSGNWYG